MSSSRILDQLAPKNIPYLKKVTPTKVMFLKSFPCEKKAADVRNAAVEAMEKSDEQAAIQGVIYSYLRSRQNENKAFYQGAAFSLTLLFFLGISFLVYITFHPLNKRKNEIILDVILWSICFGLLILDSVLAVGSLINLLNTLRYKETRQGCEAWLKNKMGEEALAQVNEYPENYKPSYESKLALLENKLNRLKR